MRKRKKSHCKTITNSIAHFFTSSSCVVLINKSVTIDEEETTKYYHHSHICSITLNIFFYK